MTHTNPILQLRFTYFIIFTTTILMQCHIKLNILNNLQLLHCKVPLVDFNRLQMYPLFRNQGFPALVYYLFSKLLTSEVKCFVRKMPPNQCLCSIYFKWHDKLNDEHWRLKSKV